MLAAANYSSFLFKLTFHRGFSGNSAPLYLPLAAGSMGTPRLTCLSAQFGGQLTADPEALTASACGQQGPSVCLRLHQPALHSAFPGNTPAVLSTAGMDVFKAGRCSGCIRLETTVLPCSCALKATHLEWRDSQPMAGGWKEVVFKAASNSSHSRI